MWTREYLESLTRKELQQLAKENQIRANEKSSIIVDKLLEESANSDVVILPSLSTKEAIQPESDSVVILDDEAKLEEKLHECIAAIDSIQLSSPLDNDQQDSLKEVTASPVNQKVLHEVEPTEDVNIQKIDDCPIAEESLQSIQQEKTETITSIPAVDVAPSGKTEREVVRIEFPSSHSRKDSASKMKAFFRHQKDIKTAGYSKSADASSSKHHNHSHKKHAPVDRPPLNCKENQGSNVAIH
eukprot:TRINITY_DN12099_c0_g1_i1.p1 TRINITY_DN12099_c0_g1~~TRINITY_DN12099_c0_g1_i1.p1  ORF type:complete len:242 (-),score=71.54 TRINITY_DN12099_c0_g1_i1:501-1226(-)